MIYLMEERRVCESDVPALGAGAERHVVGRGGRGAGAGAQRARRARTQHRAAPASYVIIT